MSWRKRLLILAFCALLVAGFLQDRGLRYPPLQLEPASAPTAGTLTEGLGVAALGAILVPHQETPTLRAFVPEPNFQLQVGPQGWEGKVRLENIHPEAEVQAEGLTFQRNGLTLVFSGVTEKALTWDIQVSLPARKIWRFAAIGDGGGQNEMAWCFQRAAELGAHFILHVGDLAYTDADADAAATTWNASPIPIYTAIGNHDFHGGHRNRWQFFQDSIGPRNSRFTVGEVTFLNLDTAADILPANGGRRGELLDQIATERKASLESGDLLSPLVVFTHRPLSDPRVLRGKRAADNAHALNRERERQWIHQSLLEIQTTALIAGHIHRSADFDDHGLRTLLSGDGLGQRGNKSRILLGEFSPGKAPIFRFEPLDFPASSLRSNRPDRL